MTKFVEKSCVEYISELSGKAPVPGGGGTSALVGAIGMALGNMVGSLTVGKKKYADVEDDIKVLMEKAGKITEEFEYLCDQDAVVFEPLSRAYGLPNGTDEEKQAKAEIMEKCLKDAAGVPVAIMEKCCEAIDIIDEFAHKGSRLVVSDAGVGVIMCKAALKGASLNVYINTKSMKDREYAEKTNAYCDDMMEKYGIRADEIFSYVMGEIK